MLRLALVALVVAGQVSVVVLLGAVPIASAVALVAVAGMVEGRRSRLSVLLAGLGLGLVVLAAATRRPELALGCIVCLGADWLLDSAESATRKRRALSAIKASR